VHHPAVLRPRREVGRFDPLGTLTTTSRGIGLAEFQLNIDHHGGNGNQVRSLDQPIATQTTKARTCLVQPFVLPPDGPQMSYKPQARSVDEPLNTIRASRGAGALVDAFIAKVNHGNGDDPNGDARRCYPLDEPLGVVTTKNGYAMVAPSIVKYNGTGKANSIEEPLDTVSTRDRFGLVEPKLTPDYKRRGSVSDAAAERAGRRPLHAGLPLAGRHQQERHRQDDRQRRAAPHREGAVQGAARVTSARPELAPHRRQMREVRPQPDRAAAHSVR
jgi:hypothetical protein